MLYFVNGELPWQGFGILNKKERYEKVMLLKQYISHATLCREYRGISFSYRIEIAAMFKHVKELDFCQEPNYAYLKGLLKSMFMADGYVYDFKFDWLAPKIQETH